MDSRRVWTIYVALLFGTFITVEAAAFQAPALPSLTRHFGISINLAATILIMYSLGMTVFAPIMGRLGDQIGRKRVLLAGMLGFSISEVIAATALNFPVFLTARFLQGLGVACIVPAVYAYIGHLFPEHKRGMALGIFAMTMTLGAASGGLLGGLLIDHYGWPSIYWISGALAFGGILPVAILVPDLRSTQTRVRFDLKGALCLFVTIGTLLSLPTWIGNFGLRSLYTAGVFATGIFGLIMLWRSSQRAAAPVVDTAILRRRAFALPTAIYWLHLMAFTGLVYALAFFINGRPGGSASQFGFVALVLYGSSMLSSPLAGRVIDRFAKPRTVSICSLAGTLLALVALVNVQLDSSLWVIAVIACLLGMMMGSNGPAVMKLAIGAVPADKLGAGTGLFSMLRDLGPSTGSSFSLAAFSISLAIHSWRAVQERVHEVGISDGMLDQLADAVANKGQDASPALVEHLQARGIELAELLRQVNVDSLATTLSNVGYLLALPIGLALLLSFALDKGAGRNNASPQDVPRSVRRTSGVMPADT